MKSGANKIHQSLEIDIFLKKIEQESKYKLFLAKGQRQYGIAPYKISTLSPIEVKKMYEKVELKYAIYEPKSGYWMKNENLEAQDNKWHTNELKIFIWITVCFAFHHNQHLSALSKSTWQFLKTLFYFKSAEILEFQIQKVIKGDLKKSHRWLKTQDKILISILENPKFEGKWNEVSKQFYLRTSKKYFRKPQQLREHWYNHLNPALSQYTWSVEEDLIIAKQANSTNRKWADIAKIFKGARTEHQIKNRFRSLLGKFKKQIHLNREKKPEIVIFEQLSLKQSNLEISETQQNSYSDLSSEFSSYSPETSSKSDSNSNSSEFVYQALQILTLQDFSNSKQQQQMLIQVNEDQFFRASQIKYSMLNDFLHQDAQNFFTF